MERVCKKYSIVCTRANRLSGYRNRYYSRLVGRESMSNTVIPFQKCDVEMLMVSFFAFSFITVSQ
jgi:hypothetical protein